MGQVHIVTDSSSHIPEALRMELGIHVVRLPYVWNGVTYLDEVDIGPREFYARLRESKSLPTTSGPTPGLFRETLEELVIGGESILLIHVGSEFSSTHKTAKLARDMFPSANIQLIDSHSNALGLGYQVLAIARGARRGRNLDELIQLSRELRERTGVVFSVADVDYIQRGGRISFGQRVLASFLNVTPLMQIENGPVNVIGRVRTSRRAIEKLVDIVEGKTQRIRPVRIGVHHADNEKGAFQLRRLVEERIDPEELILEELTPILGIHTGPGALGLAYCIGI